MNATAEQLVTGLGPLIEVNQVECILCISRESVVRMVEARLLRGCDIGLGELERAFRVYRYSLARMLSGEAVEQLPIADIMPHSRDTLLRRELGALLGCTEEHVKNLSKAGELGPTNNCQSQRWRFKRQNVIEFLGRREIR